MQLARHAVHCRMNLLVIHHHVMTLSTLLTSVQSSLMVSNETYRLSSQEQIPAITLHHREIDQYSVRTTVPSATRRQLPS